MELVGSKMSSRKLLKLNWTPETIPTAWELKEQISIFFLHEKVLIMISKGQFSFDTDKVADRAFSTDPLTMFEMKKNTKHVDFLLNRNVKENWTRKTFEAGKLKETPLKRSDFEKLRISLLNMSQISKCLTDTAASEPGSSCWKLPRFEDSNYITDDNDYDVELSGNFENVLVF